MTYILDDVHLYLNDGSIVGYIYKLDEERWKAVNYVNSEVEISDSFTWLVNWLETFFNA